MSIFTIRAVVALFRLTSLLESWLVASLNALVTCDTWAMGMLIGSALAAGAISLMRSTTKLSTPLGLMVVRRLRLNFYA